MLEELFSLKDQVAVVTGGNPGIGLSLAGFLMGAGARIAIVGRNAEAGKQAAARPRGQGGEAAFFPADVSKQDQVEAMAEAIEKVMGPIDILINSAGINIRKKAIEFQLE